MALGSSSSETLVVLGQMVQKGVPYSREARVLATLRGRRDGLTEELMRDVDVSWVARRMRDCGSETWIWPASLELLDRGLPLEQARRVVVELPSGDARRRATLLDVLERRYSAEDMVELAWACFQLHDDERRALRREIAERWAALAVDRREVQAIPGAVRAAIVDLVNVASGASARPDPV